MTSTAADFLMGSASPSAKFPDVGTTVGGVITRIGDPIQQRDYATGTPKTWDDGSPQLHLPIDLQTDLRDPEITDDDGSRTLYIKGQMKKAITDAVRAAGAKMLEVGGTLTVTYSGNGEASKKGFNPPKVYTATYAPPANAAAAAFLGSDDKTEGVATPSQTVDVSTLPPEVQELLAKVQAGTPG